VCKNGKITKWAIAIWLRGKNPTAMSVIEFEGDVSCVVEALKRTRCLGFCPLLLHEDTEKLAHTICWPVTGSAGIFRVFYDMEGDEGRGKNALGKIWVLCQNTSECKSDKR
jgi:hypothetical protein